MTRAMHSGADRALADILARLRQVLPDARRSYALHEPQLDDAEAQMVCACLETGFISTASPVVAEFEARLCEFTGASHAIATVSGTAALHLILLAAGVEPGDEIILPALTFVATANAVRYCQAVPHFADSSRQTLGLDACKLAAYLETHADLRPDGCYNRATKRRIRAIIAVHVCGHPADLLPLQQLGAAYNLAVIEDAAGALGSRYHGLHAGASGHSTMAAFSFNGNKIMTTGGGGVILTNNAALASRMRHLGMTAKLPHQWHFFHDQIGYNYRLPGVNAAIGITQLAKLPAMLEQKRKLALAYKEAFAGCEHASFMEEPPDTQSNYWLNTLLLEDEQLLPRLLPKLHDAGILCRPFWTPLHRLPMYQDCPRMALATAEQLFRQAVNLPSSSFLGGVTE